MKAILIISFLLSFGLLSIAQEYPFLLTDTSKQGIAMSGDYFHNTNSISNAFIVKIYRSEFIDDTSKTDFLSGLKQNNKIFFQGTSALSAFTTLPKQKLIVFTSIEEHAIVKTNLPDNVFNLILNGNNAYAGKTLSINNLTIQSMHYEQIRIGILKNLIHNTSKFQFGGALSFISGNRFMDMDFNTFTFTTQSNGDFININSEGYYSRSDSMNHYIQPSGKGFGVDLLFSFKNTKNKCDIIISDIGNIWWNKKSLYYDFNDSLLFTGFTIYKPAEMDTDIKKNIDSLKTRYLTVSRNKNKMTLPTNFNVTYTRTIIPEKLEISTELNTSLWIYSSSDLSIITTYKYKRIACSLITGFNSISRKHFGLSTLISFPYNWQLGLQCAYINSFINPEHAYASGLQCTIKKQF